MLQSTTVKFFARKPKILDRNLYRRFCIKIFFQRHEKWTRVVLPAAKNRLRHYSASDACVDFLEFFIKKINHKVGQASGLWSRGGTSPSFCARAEFQVWLLSPEKPKPTLICLEPASSPSSLQIKQEHLSLSLLLWKLGLLSLEPGSYLLRAKKLFRAIEPKPWFVPPLLLSSFLTWEPFLELVIAEKIHSNDEALLVLNLFQKYFESLVNFCLF